MVGKLSGSGTGAHCLGHMPAYYAVSGSVSSSPHQHLSQVPSQCRYPTSLFTFLVKAFIFAWLGTTENTGHFYFSILTIPGLSSSERSGEASVLSFCLVSSGHTVYKCCAKLAYINWKFGKVHVNLLFGFISHGFALLNFVRILHQSYIR